MIELTIEFITGHIATISVCLLIAMAVFFAIRKLLRDRRKGRFLCGDSCGACPYGETCHKNK